MHAIYTRRPNDLSDPGSRIDALGITISRTLVGDRRALTASLGFVCYGDLLGYALQFNWHNASGVARPIPSEFDDPYVEVVAGGSVELPLLAVGPHGVSLSTASMHGGSVSVVAKGNVRVPFGWEIDGAVLFRTDPSVYPLPLSWGIAQPSATLRRQR